MWSGPKKTSSSWSVLFARRPCDRTSLPPQLPRIEMRRIRIEIERRVSRNLRERGSPGTNHRAIVCHCFQHRKSKSFILGWINKSQCVCIESPQFAIAYTLKKHESVFNSEACEHFCKEGLGLDPTQTKVASRNRGNDFTNSTRIRKFFVTFPTSPQIRSIRPAASPSHISRECRQIQLSKKRSKLQGESP